MMVLLSKMYLSVEGAVKEILHELLILNWLIKQRWIGLFQCRIEVDFYQINRNTARKDFRILCLEEPEAHLHPAMQYKLFKYLRDLDDTDGLNQQIFITTHSSNISAVAGIDNMFMLAYNREGDNFDCSQQSLLEQFADKDGTTVSGQGFTEKVL